MPIFNILHGFPEALVRGMRSSFLADPDYHHLTQCETLDDVRLNLSETDYAESVADMTSLVPTGLQKAAIDKVKSTNYGAAFCAEVPAIVPKIGQFVPRAKQYWLYVTELKRQAIHLFVRLLHFDCH